MPFERYRGTYSPIAKQAAVIHTADLGGVVNNLLLISEALRDRNQPTQAQATYNRTTPGQNGVIHG